MPSNRRDFSPSHPSGEAGTFQIVEGVRELDGVGVSELATYIGVPKSTVHDHLQTLAAKTGEHANPMIEEHGRDSLLYKAKGENADHLAHARMRVRLQTTSLGKATPAHLQEECVEGMRRVAAPNRSDDGVLGAVSVSGPTSRMQGDRFEDESSNFVLSTVNVIEVNVKYS